MNPRGRAPQTSPCPAAPDAAAGPSDVEPVGSAGRSAVAGRLAALFAGAPSRPVTAGRVALAGAAVLAGTAYCLGRVGGPGALDSIWAEDASNFLSDALTERPVATILEPVNGYFLVVPRLLAELAAIFPIGWAPGVLSASAASCTAVMGLIVYCASGALLPHRLARAVVAAGIVAAPAGENRFTNVLDSVAPLQFPMLFALFWTVLWAPRRRLSRVAQLGFVLLCAVSTFLAVVFVPLALLRVAVRRDRSSAALLAAFLAGAALQVYGLVAGVSSRGDISHPRPDPLWALRSFATWALPFGLLGPAGVRGAGTTTPTGLAHTGSGTGTAYLAAVAGAWSLVAVVVAVAAAGWTRPVPALAILAGGYAVGLLAVEIMVQGELVLRYVFPVSLLVVTALVALLSPRPEPPAWRATVPLLALALVLAAAAATNYRSDTLRTRALAWTAALAGARATCADPRRPAEARIVLLHGYSWHVRIPCDRLS